MPIEGTRIGLEVVILSEVCEAEKEKYHLTPLSCRIWKEVVHMNLFTK